MVLEGLEKKIRNKAKVNRLLSSINKQDLYISLFNNNHAVMLLIDPETGRIVDANPAASQFYGYSKEQLIQKYITEINTLSKEEVFIEMQRAKKGKKNCFNFRHRLASGEIRDVESYSGTIKVENQKLLYSIVHDVSERKKNESTIQEAYAELNQIFNIASDGLCLIDSNYNVLRVNKSYLSLCGKKLEEAIGKKCFNIFPSSNCNTPNCPVTKIIAGEEASEDEVERITSQGQKLFCVATATPFRNSKGEVTGILESIKDISSQKKAEEKINFMAYHDALTGLPNRYQFTEYLGHSLKRCKKLNERLSVLFIDLDRFKLVNDTMGHSMGDLLLQQAAERLQACVRREDIVARYGGDEFIILLNYNGEDKVEAVAERIIKKLSKGFNLNGIEAYTSPSIGISIFPVDGPDEEALIKNADTAMYLAKDKGRSNYQFYSADLNELNSRQMFLENRLRKALENNEFILHYQPQVELSTGEIIGLEALLRWKNPEIGMVSPLEFIPIAEENGLIIPIGKWVLESACQQIKSWQQEGLPPIKVAVNISAKQFQDARFTETVIDVLGKTKLNPKYLELEITESFMQNIDELNAILNRLKILGVNVAVDDFGTGYCSLSLLKNLPIDKVKIDQSFIKNVTEDCNTAALVKTIITMGHNLNFRVTAEGIEEVEQLDFLKSNNCNFGQGFLFAKPLEPSLAVEYIKGKEYSQGGILLTNSNN